MNALRSATPASETAEPGVQLYADPDSQRRARSPLAAAGIPLTNAAGQIAVDPEPSEC